jgi:hypothetical protein
VTEGQELALDAQSDEATAPAPRHVLQEDSLDGILRTELEDLISLRLNEFPGQAH